MTQIWSVETLKICTFCNIFVTITLLLLQRNTVNCAYFTKYSDNLYHYMLYNDAYPTTRYSNCVYCTNNYIQ